VEVWFRRIFLSLLAILMLSAPARLLAQSDESDEGGLVEPEIDRVEFDEAKINSDDFEIAFYSGLIAVEDFSTEVVSGFKIGYQVSENFFVQGSMGNTAVGETSYEILSGNAPLLTAEERKLEYYLVGLGFNLMPGEAFVTDFTTFNTMLYLFGGTGTTTFAGEDRFTIAYALGYRSFFNNGMSIDVEARDLIFEMDIFGEEKTTHNMEVTLAINLFF
jgi:outer membrane beta-barrel protein